MVPGFVIFVPSVRESWCQLQLSSTVFANDAPRKVPVFKIQTAQKLRPLLLKMIVDDVVTLSKLRVQHHDYSHRHRTTRPWVVWSYVCNLQSEPRRVADSRCGCRVAWDFMLRVEQDTKSMIDVPSGHS